MFASPWKFAFATWLGLFLMMLGWAAASPVSAGPDESGHIMKAAATVRGDLTGAESDMPGNRAFRLPADVGDVGGTLTCYVGQPDVTAACAPSLESLGSEVVEVHSGAAAYNPLYYALVGWPSLFVDGTSMVVLMRAVNAVIVSGLWAVGLVTLTLRQPGRMPYLLVALTPLAVYLGGIVNPSGAEVAATAAAAGIALAVVNSRSASMTLPVLTVVVGVLLINLRSISPLFLALAVVFVALVSGVRRTVNAFTKPRYLAAIVVLFVSGVGAVLWTLLVSSSSGFIPSAVDRRPGKVEAFLYTVEHLDNQFVEMVGILGWFDAPIPEPVTIIWFALFSTLVVAAVLVASTKRALLVFLAAGLVVLIPALLQAATAQQVGYIWQGRYSLPLLALLMVVASVAVPSGVWTRVRPGRLCFIAVALQALHVWSFMYVLKRYAAGQSAPWSQLWSAEAWQPVGGAPLVIACFTAGSAVLALLAVGRLTSISSIPALGSKVRNARLP